MTGPTADPAAITVGPSHDPDRYQLLTLLGAGGEGEVWLAADTTQPGSRLAVKTSSVHRTDEDIWQQWALAVRSFDHPGLVRVHDAFTGAGKHRPGQSDASLAHRYVVMDYVDGVTLSDWITDNPHADIAQRRALLRDIGAALDALHAGIGAGEAAAHGDVKPHNVIVKPDGRPVLLDLGLSRFTASTGFTGRSNAYAAPEQRGDAPRATPEADAYAFALTAAATYSGAAPPVGADGYLDVDRLRQRLRGNPLTRPRPLLRHALLGAVTAPPQRRPRNLVAWVDRPRRRALTLVIVAAMLICGGGAAAALTNTSGNGRHPRTAPQASFAVEATNAVATPTTTSVSSRSSAHGAAPVKPFVSDLAMAMQWPGDDGCGNVSVAAPAAVSLAKTYGNDGIVRVIERAGGGAWTSGLLTLTFSTTSGATVHVLRITLTRAPVAPPAWVLQEVPPPRTAGVCAESTTSDTGYFSGDLDADSFREAPSDSSPLPIAIGPGANQLTFYTAYIGLAACAGNYAATITAFYTQGSDPTVHSLRTDRVVVFGYAHDTQVNLGYQNPSGDVTVVASGMRTGSGAHGCVVDSQPVAAIAPVNLPSWYHATTQSPSPTPRTTPASGPPPSATSPTGSPTSTGPTSTGPTTSGPTTSGPSSTGTGSTPGGLTRFRF